MKKLHVKQVTKEEITKQWGFSPAMKSQVMFIRCNAKGIINWDNAPVYSSSELVGRDNVKVLS